MEKKKYYNENVTDFLSKLELINKKFSICFLNAQFRLKAWLTRPVTVAHPNASCIASLTGPIFTSFADATMMSISPPLSEEKNKENCMHQLE